MSKVVDYFVQGWGLYMRFNRAANVEARKAYQNAIDADEEGTFCRAHADLAYSMVHAWYFGWDKSMTLQQAKDTLEKSPECCRSDYYYLMIKAGLHLYSREFDEARTLYEKSWAAAPGQAIPADLEALRADRAEMFLLTGRTKDAIKEINLAIDSMPVPDKWFYWVKSWAYYEDGQWQEALDAIRKNIGSPRNAIRKTVICSLVKLKRESEAAKEAELFLKEEASQSLAYGSLEELLGHEDRIPFENLDRRKDWKDTLRVAFAPHLKP